MVSEGEAPGSGSGSSEWEDTIMAQLWEQVLQNLEGRLNRQTFETWFRPTRELTRDGNNLDVWVPSSRFADWIHTNFGNQIQDALRELGQQTASVRYVAAEEAAPPVLGRRKVTVCRGQCSTVLG